MSDKKRILFCGEFSGLNTGFSNLYRCLLPRLVQTNKYIIGEHASYVDANHPDIQNFVAGRWKVYPGLPSTPEEHQEFQKGVQSPYPQDKQANISQFGFWNFDKVLCDFQPDIVCTPPGQLVMTSDGYKPIEDIKIGDLVLTHKGRFRKVLKTMRRQHVGDIRKIYMTGFPEPLNLTNEHPVLIYRRRKQTNQRKSIRKIYCGFEPEFVAAQDVKKGDLIVLPTWTGEQQKINITNYLDNFIEIDALITTNQHKTDHKIFKDIIVSEHLARLIGYILADGSVDKTCIQITFNKTEQRFADDVKEIIKQVFGIDCTTFFYPKDQNEIRVRVCCSLISEFFKNWFAPTNSTKFLPYEIWQSPITVRQQCLSGLVRGDGNYSNYKGIHFGNRNKKLAYNVRMLYSSIGIPCTVNKCRGYEDYANIGKKNKWNWDVAVSQTEFANQAHSFIEKKEKYITYENPKKGGKRTHYVNNQIVASVIRTRKTDYRGQVYNLEIEDDNSYVLQSCVHNCDIRDAWMMTWQLRSPFRDFVKILWQPTIDSPQQMEDWIADYEKANLITAYSDFGIHTLKSQSPKIKIFPKPMRPGVDLDTFYPMDKTAIREKFNLSKDIRIIGKVSRNQSRKLFLDTIDAFSLMKLNNKKDEVVKKSVLLLHTSWPDNMHSFDYPRHIKRLQQDKWMRFHNPGIMYDVLQTLICHNCGEASVVHAANLFNRPVQQANINGKKIVGILMPCTYCGQQTATCPNTGVGFTREQMAEMYNLLDVGVQVSIAEGCSMTCQEMKACGVPIIVTDHSATTEKGRFPAEYIHIKELGIKEEDYTVNKGGMTHKVVGYRHEPETHCLRAVPDINDIAEKMKLLITDDKLRAQMSVDARACAEQNYDWDKMAKQWEFVFDNIKPIDRTKTWDSPIEIIEPVKSTVIPDNLSDEQYISWLYLEILKYPKIDEAGAAMWLQHLQKGVTRQQLMDQFVQIANQQIEPSRQRNLLRQQHTTEASKVQEQEWL